jgi:UDPglucose--hexose-1-phosphate uridylyltransferase
MTDLVLADHPHRRLNILTGEWILVSPHRAKRPWQGQIENVEAESLPKYDPNCYLCPGNERAGGIRNPNYSSTFVFTNDFGALLPESPKEGLSSNGLLVAKGEQGVCRVVCFSPRHDLTLPEMEVSQIKRVVDTWIGEYESLGSRPNINYVQIFENKGQVMGCSNPHPHGQIWAHESIPTEPFKELTQMAEYLRGKDRCLLCDYLRLELDVKERLVCENDEFVVLVPFWAVWPYEIMIVPSFHISSLSDFSEAARDDLADMMKRVGIRYDNLFETSFPYSMGIHQAPLDGQDYGYWHMHLHYLPPLLRSATVRKFMVGYELLAMPQRDITAEQAAAALRSLPGIHFMDA